MHARFLKSAAGAEGFPADTGVEVAVAGRSNSGKSTALNRIVGHGKLARVSKTPGRTQLVNFFELGPDARLVDLPGYGFARVPIRMRDEWRRLMTNYFEGRGSLTGLILTVDIRRGLNDLDRQMIDWAVRLGLKVLLLLTKADKLSRGAGLSRRLEVARELEARIEVLPFSALDGTGVELARQRLGDWLGQDREA